MTIVVHHLESSRSQRVLWLLEELGLPYEIKRYRRDPATRMGDPAMKAVHPLGKSPTVEVDGVAVAESGAIFEHLIDTKGEGRLRPAAGTPERVRYTFWLHYVEGSVMPMMSMRWVMNSLPMSAPEAIRGAVADVVAARDANLVAPSLKTHMDFWEGELGRSKYLAGNDFTAADVMMGSALDTAATTFKALDGRPKLEAWLGGLRERPAFQRAAEKGRF